VPQQCKDKNIRTKNTEILFLVLKIDAELKEHDTLVATDNKLKRGCLYWTDYKQLSLLVVLFCEIHV
jgi:hypothetical protein